MARINVHIRADGPQGVGDGSSYANAYGWADFVASGDASAGGNTFWIHGLFKPYLRATVANGDIGAVWTFPNGTSKEPTIIRGDDPTNPCEAFWGGYRWDMTWTAEGGGVYSLDLTGINATHLTATWGFEGDLASETDYTTLTRVETEIGMPAGSFYWNAIDTIYVRMSDDSDPAQRFWIGGLNGNRMHPAGNNYIQVYKIPSYSTWSHFQGLSSDRPSYFWVTACKLWYSSGNTMSLFYEVDNIHIRRCDVAEGRDGIYLISQEPVDNTKYARNCSITRCHIHDIGYESGGVNDRWESYLDSGACSVQHIDGLLYHDNRISNVRLGLDSWAGLDPPTLPHKNITVYRNHVSGLHTNAGKQAPAGLSISSAGSQWEATVPDSEGNEMKWNAIDGDLGGGNYAGRGINLGTGPALVTCEYNLVSNVENGFTWGRHDVKTMDVRHYYNKYRGVTVTYWVHHDQTNAGDTYDGNWNSYAGAASLGFRFNGTNYANLAAAQAAGWEGPNST